LLYVSWGPFAVSRHHNILCMDPFFHLQSWWWQIESFAYHFSLSLSLSFSLLESWGEQACFNGFTSITSFDYHVTPWGSWYNFLHFSHEETDPESLRNTPQDHGSNRSEAGVMDTKHTPGICYHYYYF
jgi:hypothetical protein